MIETKKEVVVEALNNKFKEVERLKRTIAKLRKDNKFLREKMAELDMDIASKQMRTYIEGMQVSVDVSTDDESTFGNRLFGTVSEVMDNSGSKHNVILLVTDVTPNF